MKDSVAEEESVADPVDDALSEKLYENVALRDMVTELVRERETVTLPLLETELVRETETVTLPLFEMEGEVDTVDVVQRDSRGVNKVAEGDKDAPNVNMVVEGVVVCDADVVEVVLVDFEFERVAEVQADWEGVGIVLAVEFPEYDAHAVPEEVGFIVTTVGVCKSEDETHAVLEEVALTVITVRLGEVETQEV